MMQTVYRLDDVSELDEDFIRSLQLLFKNRPVEIMVKDISHTKNKPTVWEAIEEFRANADFDAIGDEDLFEDVRDTELGREVNLS